MHRCEDVDSAEGAEAEFADPSPVRRSIAKAFQMGMSVEDVNKLTVIDHWFSSILYHIHAAGQAVRKEERRRPPQQQPQPKARRRLRDRDPW